jgi:sensor histidine kinase YesM
MLLLLILLMCYEGFVLKNKQTRVMFLSWLPLFIAVFMDVMNDFFRYMPRRTAIKYGFAISVLIQFYQLVRLIRANTKKTMRLEYELLNSRVDVMLSQIQPHFLFNTLNDIRFLYREAPGQAEEALVSFTRYLRENMDSLNQKDLVPLMQELNHVQNFINIEKMRFGDRLKVNLEIGSSQFFVPVLTIQPLMENAIRHGVMEKSEGGTVTVRTYEDVHDFIIVVKDDGVGFDPSAILEDGRTHNGIKNVRTRLRIMCGGSLEIMSRIGEGTSIIIHIPKERQNENYRG